MVLSSLKAATNVSRLPLGQVLGALSLALDLTEGQPPGHCARACWIGMRIGEALGLDTAALDDLYYAVMLKDLGCSSNAARIAQLYLTDDLRFKQQAGFLVDGAWPALRFIVRHTGVHAGLVARARATAGVIRRAGAIVRELTQTRCERGADIARQLRFSPAVAAGIRGLDEHWNGAGRPLGLGGQAIPLFSRIALLAQVVDVYATGAGPEAASEEVRRRTGTWFDPEVAGAFHGIARDARLWQTIASPDIIGVVAGLAPAQRLVAADDGYFDDIAVAFAQVVDAKSPYTAGHSERVAGFTEMIAARLGFSPASTRALKRAALLHDIGKLGVSNAILDKPAKLDDIEWQAMRQHPVHSERILKRIGAFDEMARIGGAHHERLDGKGYPRGIGGAEISLSTRIVTTADVCDALTAHRPYRAAMPVQTMLQIMRRDVGTAFDPACFEALTQLADSPDFVAQAQGGADAEAAASA